MQRQKDFAAYQDLESNFERRPSLWAEPIGDWGEGAVKLLEIPTNEEVHDNIATFWQPKAPLPAKSEHTYTYRLHWDRTPPSRPRWHGFPGPASAQGATTPSSSCSTSPARS
jgi:glucans biosynthesis protein